MSSKNQRKLAAAKARQKRRVQEAEQLRTVYREIPSLDLTDGLKLAITSGADTRCVMRMMFSPRTPDFYVALPYLRVSTYLAGVAEVVGDLPTTFDAEASGERGRVPFKLSYHESGEVHLKPLSKKAAEVGQVVTNAAPIRYLDGDHVFTFEAEGLGEFAKPKPKDFAKSSFVAYDLLEEKIERLRVVCYAGFAPAVVSGKYSSGGKPLPPSLTLAIARPGYGVPLYLGLYFQIGKSIQRDPNVRASELLIGGFSREGHKLVYTMAALKADALS